MGNIWFAGKEHEAFYYNMPALRAIPTCTTGRFSTRWGLVRKQGTISVPCFTLRESASSRKTFRRPGRLEELSVFAVWPLTFGTGGRKRERRDTSHRMNCLTAALRLTFSKRFGCAIRNIVGVRSIANFSSPQRDGKFI